MRSLSYGMENGAGDESMTDRLLYKEKRRKQNRYYMLIVFVCILLFVMLFVLFVATMDPSDLQTSANRLYSGANPDPQTNPAALPIPTYCTTKTYSSFMDDIANHTTIYHRRKATGVIRNVHVWTGAEEYNDASGFSILRNQDVFIVNGLIDKIVAHAENTSVPSDCEFELYGNERILTPGLIDMHTHAGSESAPSLRATRDNNEATSPLTSQVRIVDSINVYDEDLQRILQSGVTSAQILPGSANVVGGEGLIIKLQASPVSINSLLYEEHVPRTLKFACGENPKRVYGAQRNTMPSTRMGSVALLRQALVDAEQWIAKQDEWCARVQSRSNEYYDPTHDGWLPDQFSLRNLVSLVRAREQVKLNVHCYTVADMQAMIRTANEFHFSIASFHHAHQAYLIADELALLNIGVAAFADHWGYKWEAYENASSNSLRTLLHSNVSVALKSDHPVLPGYLLMYEAAKSTHYGLSDDQALASVTRTPAQLLGIDAWAGTLEVGKHADMVLWDEHPLRGHARPVHVWVQGRFEYNASINNILSNNNADQLSPYDEEVLNLNLSVGTENNLFIQILTQNQYFSYVRPTCSVRVNYPGDSHSFLACENNDDSAAKYPQKAILIKNVDILDLSDTRRTLIYTECDIGIRVSLIECINCKHAPPNAADTGKFRTACSSGYASESVVEYTFSMAANEKTNQTLHGWRPLVMPSFISSASSSLGMVEIEGEFDTQDGSSMFDTERVRAIYGARLGTRHVREAWLSGIGVTVAAPVQESLDDDTTLIQGQSAALTTFGLYNDLNTSIIKEPLALHITIGANVRRNKQSQRIDRELYGMHTSISGQLSLIEQLLYAANSTYLQTDEKKLSPFELILLKRIVLAAHVDQAEHMAALMQLKQKFNFELIIEGAAEVHLVAKQVAASGTRIILSPIVCSARRSWSSLRCNEDLNVGALLRENIMDFGIAIEHVGDVRQLRWMAARILRQSSTNYAESVSTVGRNIALAYKLPREYQEIKEAQVASFVVFDNDPLSMHSRVLLHVRGQHVGCSPRAY